MSVFSSCHHINNLIRSNKQSDARDSLIRLLDYHEQNDLPYTPLVNHLVREVGLYPYIIEETSDWQERYIIEAFKVQTSKNEYHVFHRDQYKLLKCLLEGKNIAVSAPTSFGKSFVIDALITIRNPNIVVIIVPTIALTDETRRRLYKKFASDYKIITTTDEIVEDKSIFIFPQERAINYINALKKIDLLIVDEFYKSSLIFDSDRAPALLRAILKLGEKATQKYYLSPNISKLIPNPFTKDMEFLKLDFNTVFLEKQELYQEINNDPDRKNQALLNIIGNNNKKSLVYAGTYSNIKNISFLLLENCMQRNTKILDDFSDWLKHNYSVNWILPKLVKLGIGIHNGQLHRSLSQIQVKLFSENDLGINTLISTSSIIEGVNTSAENVIIWMNKNGRARLNDFTYKNIIGRGGRMFKHFIGKIYILDAPPPEELTQLEIPFPNEILGDLDENHFLEELSDDQISNIISYRKEMQNLFGIETYNYLKTENLFQTSDFELIKNIAINMKQDPDGWGTLRLLNFTDSDYWDAILYKVLNYLGGKCGARYQTIVNFVKILSHNWVKTIPDMLTELECFDIGIDDFFKLERTITFTLASALEDINLLHKTIINDGTDIVSFVSKISHAFLPKIVFQLEEYGLPRMLSKKIHICGIINFKDEELSIHQAIDIFHSMEIKYIAKECRFNRFEFFVLSFFYEGIETQ